MQLVGDQPPVSTWVKADIDRYVRKVGFRSIEDTRYQARLDTKVEELARVYCSEEFIQDLYCTLAKDREFVDMLRSVWHLKYRLLVMYRQALVRTDSGYHVPSSEEVIAGIKAYFDPGHLVSDAAPSAVVDWSGDSPQIRAKVLKIFSGLPYSNDPAESNSDVQGIFILGLLYYAKLLRKSESTGLQEDGDFTTLASELSEAVSTLRDLTLVYARVFSQNGDYCTSKLGGYFASWVAVHTCLENPNAGPACECPYVYFFVKFCLDRGLGVPKLALTAYDWMNMQLSREFIRCANPTCELNKLDQSTGQVKFKQCSRCRTVIYCSRECQTAHYPDHKPLCTKHPTSVEGS